jgi:hypothetical protein
MPFPLIPIAIVGLAGLAFRAKSNRDATFAGQNMGIMTPSRQVIYDTAMNKVEDPQKLIAIASQFEAQGLPDHGDMLRKRAALRSLPDAVKKARHDAFVKGMQSKDRMKVIALAAAFHREGCSGSAADLYKYAAGLPTESVPTST